MVLKILQMFFDLILAAFLRDNLLVSPLLVTIEVTEILITMGAEDFTDFVLAYFVESVITILERIYLDPLLKSTASRVPKWRMSCTRRCRKSRRITREQRLKEEIEWRRLNDEIQLEAEGVEPLLDSFYVYSNETLALFLTPFVQLLLLSMDASSLHEYQITQIPDNYGIRCVAWRGVACDVCRGGVALLLLVVFVVFVVSLVHMWSLVVFLLCVQPHRFNLLHHLLGGHHPGAARHGHVFAQHARAGPRVEAV